MTSDERRVKRLSPAMRRWKEKLADGYTIEPGLRAGRHGGMEWGPSLFNPEGRFVQTVRRDTFRRLLELGLVGEEPNYG